MDTRVAAPMTPAADSLDFLAGGGEMGKVIRAMDWAATPLGPIESWPQSLRTAVSLCVASNFPISIAWGPAHVQIYNDGFWPICGQKHPVSMGQDYTLCWASAWDAIGAAFERACAGETSYLENQRVFVDRNGFLEETFFTFSFSPIRDETGAVGGVFHPVTEQTGRILNERRVRMLRDLATRAGSAKTTDDLYACAIETFAEHPFDLPFVLLYRLNETGTFAECRGHTGLAAETLASFLDWDLTTAPERWPIAKALQSRTATQVDGLDDQLAALAFGPYPEAPNTALLLPIFIPGADLPRCILIAGVSPRLPLDRSYRDFYGMLAASMSSCLANAWNFERERQRAKLLAELDHAKTTFFSNVSHEFRTPLALILGPLDDMLDTPSTRPAPETEALRMIRRNAQRLLKLVNTLLDFSRLEAGQTQLRVEPTDLARATAEHASSFRSVCEKAGLRLTVECDPSLNAVYVDREMWEKITLNLISNAFKFTFAGEINVTLRRLPEDRIELTVRDTGTGIPAKDLPNIFNRFTRVTGAAGRSHEGSGIGLALVQELAQLHGGSVAVESEIGAGSSFRVQIPLQQAAPARAGLGQAPRRPPTLRARGFVDEASLWLPAPKAPAPARPGAKPAVATPLASILLAEDNADMRAYITRILTEQGFDVQATGDGQAALDALARSPLPDLILTDVMMPRRDGFELLKDIRANPRLSHLPVIMLSARAGEAANVEGLDAGADDYLVKPFGARELVARVEGNLNMARLRKRLAQQDRFAMVVDASPAALLLVGAAGQIELANRQAEALFGYGRDELVDTALENLLPERHRRNHPALRQGFMARRVFRKLGEGQELFGLRRDQTEIPLEISLNPIDANGETKVLVAVIDITTRRKIENEKEAQRQELERSNRDLESFAYIASHDLKAPLRAITHLADWITEDIGSIASPRTLEYLATLKGRTTRLQGLLEGLLDYSQIGRLASRSETVDVEALVQDILMISSPPPGFTVTCVTPAARLHTRLTPLRMVLDNLIGNASKHHDRDSGKITVAMQMENGLAEFRVSDDGPGIKPQFHSRIFEIFRTLASRDVVESTGLGLAIVKKMVELHGGQVRIESAPPRRGATFIFTWKEVIDEQE